MGPWVVLGALAGVALANIGSRWILLLVPVAVAGAVLIWQLNPKQEFFGSIAGFAVLPVIVGTRPVPCALDGCDITTQIVWPFLAVALALLVVGVLLGTRSPSSLNADESHEPSLPPGVERGGFRCGDAAAAALPLLVEHAETVRH